MSAMKRLLEERTETALDAYLECALWATLDYYAGDDNYNPPLDENFTVEDIGPKFRSNSFDTILQFILDAGEDLDTWTDEQLGHDLWLTREGHGAGFWDRGVGDPAKDAAGNRLSELARALGGAGDDLNEAIIDEARIAATA